MWYSPVEKEQNAQNRQGNTIDTSKYPIKCHETGFFNEKYNAHYKQ